ncbi:MAG: hypothetical protein HOW73_32770 [Polyangiaceae bacterium]|nr:hypothetical protein [Polyangiaceae bacterium]
MDLDTVRPPGEGGEDAYSAETVVKAVPKELLHDLERVLKPAKVPSFGPEIDAGATTPKATAPIEEIAPASRPREEEPIAPSAASPVAEAASPAAAEDAAPAASVRDVGLPDVDVSASPDAGAVAAAPESEPPPWQSGRASWLWLAVAVACGLGAAVVWSRCG